MLCVVRAVNSNAVFEKGYQPLFLKTNLKAAFSKNKFKSSVFKNALSGAVHGKEHGNLASVSGRSVVFGQYQGLAVEVMVPAVHSTGQCF